MKQIIILLTIGLLGACSSDQSSNSEEATYAINYNQEEAIALMDSYLHLKDALVDGNSNEAQQHAAALVDLLEGRQDKLSNQLLSIAKVIQMKGDLEEQRKQFDPLSRLFYSIASSDLLKGQGYTKQYCPMAFDHEGAYWFSDKEEIFNPYFGDKMLHCGHVEEQY